MRQFECVECPWCGDEDELDEGYCPDCGADVEEVEEDALVPA